MAGEEPYRKPPTISPGLIYFRNTTLYKGGGLIYGWAYTWTIFCVDKQVRHKQVSHKQGNKRVYMAYIRVGLYSGGGLIFGMR
jgi:hypothetical protein